MTRPRRLILAAATLGTAAALLPTTMSVAATHGRAAYSRTVQPPAVPGSRYLALGDSIAFGFRESANLPTPDYSKPGTFRSYAMDLAANLGLRLTDAACPGETTSSFLNTSGPSNGCENFYDPNSQSQTVGGYRVAHPLHVAYTGSQFAFAKQFLRAHRDTRLVTITMGANDAFRCQAATSDGCISEYGSVLSSIRKNLATTLKGMRATGYDGQIVIVNYYSLNYGNSILTGEVMALNQALAQAAQGYHATIASAFDAFQAATAQTSGDACAAALVTVLTSGGCGVHPSVAGHALLAQTAERLVTTH